MYLLIRNDALEPQKTVDRICEGMSILGIWVHHKTELADISSNEVDSIAIEIARIDFWGIDLDDGPVFRITPAAAEVDGRREGDMS